MRELTPQQKEDKIRITSTKTLANNEDSWKFVAVFLVSGILLMFLGFAPDVLKIEIPDYVWYATAIAYGAYTFSWLCTAFNSIRRGEQVGRICLNFFHVAWCIMTCVSVAIKYSEPQNQTLFSMVPLLVLAILSFVPLEF